MTATSSASQSTVAAGNSTIVYATANDDTNFVNTAR